MKEKEEIERRLERKKNDHRNSARNRTRDFSLSGRLLYQLSYWARSDSDQITEPVSPYPTDRMPMPTFSTKSTDIPGRPTQWNPPKLGKVRVVAKILLENTLGEWRINILKEKEE